MHMRMNRELSAFWVAMYMKYVYPRYFHLMAVDASFPWSCQTLNIAAYDQRKRRMRPCLHVQVPKGIHYRVYFEFNEGAKIVSLSESRTQHHYCFQLQGNAYPKLDHAKHRIWQLMRWGIRCQKRLKSKDASERGEKLSQRLKLKRR